MTTGPTSPAELPDPGLDGLDPRWSRLVTTPELDGVGRTWHVLDNQVADPTVTLLCVHGNPTWSYLWRDLISRAPSGVRVIAIDHLDMGFSERTGATRRLEQRVDDLGALTDELDLTGPIVTVAHDWGGPISLGWAQRHREQLGGVVLMNTAVHQPAGSPAPGLIRMVRTPGVLERICTTTPSFIRGTMALTRPRVDRTIREAYEAPYRSADRRAAIAAFVEDIPLDEDHPSQHVLDRIAADLEQLTDVPALLLWGPSDPVFSDLYLRDLAARLPNADIHRFLGAGHLTPEDADVASAVYAWVEQREQQVPQILEHRKREPVWAGIDRRADERTVAIVEMGSDGEEGSISFAELAADVRRVAAGLVDLGVAEGDRVGLLIPPGIELAVCLYACWRMGAVVVIADAGLGVRGMGRALAGANPAYLIGTPQALAVARTMRWPGVRIATATLDRARKRMLDVRATLADLRHRGEGRPVPTAPNSLDVAAVVFTSGATGPAKGVVYRHRQIQAQRDAIVDLFGVRSDDSLVAAFGPFALFGPAMGIPSVVPDMKVVSPGSLTASALADAAETIEATLVFASPAAMTNVVKTAGEMSPGRVAAMRRVRVLMSAGAPVPVATMRAMSEVMPAAEMHSPYGMTEVLPVADISLAEIEAVPRGNGVCVGHPVPGVDVAISPLDPEGRAADPLTGDSGVVGEVCVRSGHMRDGYDQLWMTENAASQPAGWHRSGDVGHIDDDGRLWIEGRMRHIVTTAGGPVTPVGIEHAVSELPDVAGAAVVGVGPSGTQQVVIVAVPTAQRRRAALADENLADRVRERAGDVDVAAVLVVPELPVDKRHNSKIDRTRIARWAERVLAGGRMGRI
ncbi:MAG: alpha/beta fold hydrolase [Actinomycetota bacterium]|nr:alpha/beta fold hydrolase [Actinomycetota bacterium]